MIDLGFHMPVKLLWGSDLFRRHSEEFSALGGRCLLITGKSSAEKSGALADVSEVLQTLGIEFYLFNRIEENPTLSVCASAGDAARRFGAEFIIGIGGGSALDAAKAAAIYAKNPDIHGEEIYRLSHRGALPFCLVGTTAGTGSEVTAVSVLTSDATGRKRSMIHPDCFARVAFADYSYTKSMPTEVTVSTALDAFSHATEGFFSPKCNDVCDLFARRALELLGKSIPALDGSSGPLENELRERLYAASLYAGFVLCRCGTGFPHPMGYILTENYHLPHGRACAAFLPAYLMRAAAYAPERIAAYESSVGCSVSDLCAMIQKMNPLTIQMSYADAEKLSARFEHNKNFANSPGGFTPEMAAALLKGLFTA